MLEDKNKSQVFSYSRTDDRDTVLTNIENGTGLVGVQLLDVVLDTFLSILDKFKKMEYEISLDKEGNPVSASKLMALVKMGDGEQKHNALLEYLNKYGLSKPPIEIRNEIFTDVRKVMLREMLKEIDVELITHE